MALFHPHLTSEEDVGSLRFSKREQQHLKRQRHAHSSPSPSPVDTKVFVKSDVFSDPHDTLLPTPTHTCSPTTPHLYANLWNRPPTTPTPEDPYTVLPGSKSRRRSEIPKTFVFSYDVGQLLPDESSVDAQLHRVYPGLMYVGMQ